MGLLWLVFMLLLMVMLKLCNWLFLMMVIRFRFWVNMLMLLSGGIVRLILNLCGR